MMKLGFLYGKWSTAIHGPFDIENLFRSRGLTGSESAFWNTIRTLAERGHEIHVHCPTTMPDKVFTGVPILGGAIVHSTSDHHDKPTLPTDCEAYIAWNEPDILKMVPEKGVRILNHQINDFVVFSPDWYRAVDTYVSVSRSHADNIIKESKGAIDPRTITIIPNSIEPDFYHEVDGPRMPGSVAFTSSPDRGLFRILEFFPEVRARVPSANLHIFYEWEKIEKGLQARTSLPAIRIRYAATMLQQLGRNGENGVHLHGNVSNVEMANFLQKTRVFAYPCEPMKYTEGFSVGTMDACVAGCVPILSDADALPEIYGEVAEFVRGKPGLRKQAWVDAIVRALTDDAYATQMGKRARTYALTYSRQNVCDLWERYLPQIIKAKKEIPAR